MKASLIVDLWRFQPLRNAVRKEATRFFLGVATGLALAAAFRYALGWIPSWDGLLSIAIGVLAIVVIWLVSVVRTIRAVLRDHEFLDAKKA